VTRKVVNRTREVVLLSECEMATSLMARARGLLGHPPLVRGQGMLISPCQSIHTFFMSFPIDVAFLNRDLRIVYIIPSMPPWRLSPHLFKAHSTLELWAGALAATGSNVGDELALLP
jgi:uncharacterized membrane protein (UPF0127 family)